MSGVTILEINAPSERSRRELPRVIGGAQRLMWGAGPAELATAVGVEVATAVGVGVAVVLGRDVLDGPLELDRIHVLDGGAAVESGGHDELVARGGLYAELFSLRAASYA